MAGLKRTRKIRAGWGVGRERKSIDLTKPTARVVSRTPVRASVGIPCLAEDYLSLT